MNRRRAKQDGARAHGTARRRRDCTTFQDAAAAADIPWRETLSMLSAVAHRELSNRAWAEDVVSETVLAAIEARSGHAGQARMSTWLVGILKHKVTDHWRAYYRHGEHEMAEMLRASRTDDFHDLSEAPADRNDPEAAYARRQLMDILQACLARLPSRQATVFTLSETMDMDHGDVCSALEASAGSVWILLHRARRRLRTELSAMGVAP